MGAYIRNPDLSFAAKIVDAKVRQSAPPRYWKNITRVCAMTILVPVRLFWMAIMTYGLLVGELEMIGEVIGEKIQNTICIDRPRPIPPMI